MIAYIYDENTKEFLYEVQVEESPLEAGVILMPPNATLEPILEHKENYAQVFNGLTWEYVEDYRGKTVWKSHSESLEIEELGVIPKGYSLEQPKPTAEDEHLRIQELSMTRSDFFDGTIQAWGVGQDELLVLIQTLLATLPLPDVKKLIAINNFKNALNFYRKHDLFKILVGMPIQLAENIQLVIEDEHLDKFFDEVDKGNKETAWQYLPSPVMIPIEDDLQVEIEEELPANEIVETEGNADEEIG